MGWIRRSMKFVESNGTFWPFLERLPVVGNIRASGLVSSQTPVPRLDDRLNQTREWGRARDSRAS